VERWFDISAFQRLDPVRDAGHYGNAGRNIVRAPGYHGLDLSLLKNFKLQERTSVQFRVECFNFPEPCQFLLFPRMTWDRQTSAVFCRRAHRDCCNSQ